MYFAKQAEVYYSMCKVQVMSKELFGFFVLFCFTGLLTLITVWKWCNRFYSFFYANCFNSYFDSWRLLKIKHSLPSINFPAHRFWPPFITHNWVRQRFHFNETPWKLMFRITTLSATLLHVTGSPYKKNIRVDNAKGQKSDDCQC